MKKPRRMRAKLMRVYRDLARHFGPQHWWPARTPFEVMVGAILTQNTAWSNVEKAIANLRAARALAPRAIAEMDLRRLARLVRPSGYYNQKAKRLRDFIRWMLDRYGSVAAMRRAPAARLRAELLARNGIGPETADSILLYALGKRSFVIDAYTRRALARLGLARGSEPYEELRDLFERNLPRSKELYGEYHALLVVLGKDLCRKKNPSCETCPLVRHKCNPLRTQA